MVDSKLEKFLEDESNILTNLLEKEFITLQYKVARCSRNCFIEKDLPESFKCENYCINSIKKASDRFANYKQNIENKLQKCIAEVNEVLEGFNEETTKAFEGPTACYRDYLIDLKKMKSEIENEFSNYY